jgi:hypothetical protein
MQKNTAHKSSKTLNNKQKIKAQQQTLRLLRTLRKTDRKVSSSTENRSESIIAMMRTNERTKTKANFGAGACRI